MTNLYSPPSPRRHYLLLALLLLTLPGRAQRVSSFAPATGPAGTSIILTGSGLDKVMGVRFGTGSLTTNFISQSATSLTVPVPLVATSGPLVLTNAAGVTVSTATAFTYTPRLNLTTTLSPAGPLDGCQPRSLKASAASPAFTTGIGFNDVAWSMAVQADGKVLVGGSSLRTTARQLTTSCASTPMAAAIRASPLVRASPLARVTGMCRA